MSPTIFSWVYSDWIAIPQTLKDSENARNKAALVNEIRGEFNLGVFAAELPEALRSVVDSSRAVLTALRYASKGKFNSAGRTLLRAIQGIPASRVRRHGATLPNPHIARGKVARLRDLPDAQKMSVADISNMWLALQYAWKPLLQDIFGLMKEVEKYTSSRSITYRKRTQTIITTKNVVIGSITAVKVATNSFYRVNRKWVLAEKPSLQWKLGLTNPAEIVWEKIPYSFVVDWFIPIGDFLVTRSAYDLSLRSWCTSYLELRSCHEKSLSAYDASGRRLSSGTFNSSQIFYSRFVGNRTYEALTANERAFPPHNPVDRAFSITHLENAAALIYGAIHKSRSSR